MMYAWLGEAIDGGATVLASSRRLARELRRAGDEAQMAAGKRAWQTPSILFWQDWLLRTFDTAELRDAPLLLPASACTLLWEQCLERTETDAVLSTRAVLRHARLAWQRLQYWEVSLAELARAAGNNDERWFARAAGAYHKRLRSAHWLDPAELPAYLADHPELSTFDRPPLLVRAGFDRRVPSLERLLERLAATGCRVRTAPESTVPGERRTASYADAAAEWRAAGAFARRTLQQDPAARVAIVAPDLESDAATIARLVREGFAPGWQVAGERHRAAVDVSYGRALSDYPLVAAALLCLQWTYRGLSGSELSVLLRSPFIGNDELAARSRLECALRALPDRHWSAADFLALCRRRNEDELSAWQGCLEAIIALQADARRKAAPAAWARRIDELLSALGWPAVARPDSGEFQLINRWRNLLNELARTGVVGSRLGLAEAVRFLQQSAAETIYQPESRAGAVHLLGLPEAAGMAFDRLWIGGLDATRWPPPGHPLPLLPRRLQREYRMPDATPDDTLAFAQQAFGRRVCAAQHVVLSWPRAEQDADLAPSPLLDTEGAPADDDPGWFAAAFTGVPLERLQDDPGPAVAATETVHGGAYTVQRQYENPFAAFAGGRLATAEFDAFESGLSARHRGIALHRALHRLYEGGPSRSELASWSETQRVERIAQAVASGLGALRQSADGILRRLLTIEARRLQQLLQAFLDEETQREAFTVTAVEERMTLQHGNVTLRLRADRIDRLGDGSLLIIDYKSGRDRNLLTRDGSLADLQLAVYAHGLSEPVGGLLLINLDSRHIAYRGVGGSVPWGGIDRDSWAPALAGCLAQVDTLLSDFASGDLRLNLDLPADRTRGLGVLSRIEELRRDG